jgi:hypothetical protein
MATAAGKACGPLLFAALRAFPVGAAKMVLAKTASADFQPSASLAAWVAAAIRSGAGVILPAAAAAGCAAAGAAGATGAGPGAGGAASALGASADTARG